MPIVVNVAVPRSNESCLQLRQLATMTNDQAWTGFRSKMPVARRWSYLDHAAVAPLCDPAREAISKWANEATEEGDTSWLRWSAEVEKTRSAAASLIGSQPDEIALVHSTSEGVNLVAEGFPWHSGDNVVTLDNEFPSNLYPWMNQNWRGVETRCVAAGDGRVTVERLLDACDARTRLISVSWVGFLSGWRLDVAKLVDAAHARGILVFLDAIQGLGVFPIDVQQTKVDFLAADGHKWLLGPEGAGIFYLCREHLDLLRPTGVGWHSVTDSSNYTRIHLDFKPSAARFEGGTQNMVGQLGLGASLGLLLELEPKRIAERVLEITDYACERLLSIGAQIKSPREAEHRSGIVSFELPGQDSLAVKKKCLQRGVVLSCRGGLLRISPHAYVNELDIDRLIEALQS
jgi:cysteine desulfurase / selenocysteine lyase